MSDYANTISGALKAPWETDAARVQMAPKSVPQTPSDFIGVVISYTNRVYQVTGILDIVGDQLHGPSPTTGSVGKAEDYPDNLARALRDLEEGLSRLEAQTSRISGS